MSETGLRALMAHEGVRLKLYNDPVGHATIGVGHLVHLGPIDGRASEHEFSAGISEAQALQLLNADLSEFAAALARMVKVELTQGMVDALLSFAFNLGSGALAKSTLLRLLNVGDYAGASRQFARWTKAGGKVLPGLVTRRADEARAFLVGYP